MSRLSILHVIDGLGGGGSEEWVAEIVRLCDPDRFQFAVCSLRGANAPGRAYAGVIASRGVPIEEVDLYTPALTRWLDRRAAAGVRLDRAASLAARTALAPWRFAVNLRRVAQRVRNVDVVHVHMYAAFPHGVLAARLLGVPAVYSFPNAPSYIERTFPRMPHWYRLVGPSVRACFTDFSPREVAAVMHVPEDRVRIIDGSIDLEAITAVQRSANPLIGELGLRDAFPVILATGRLVPMKGQDLLVRALPRLRARCPRARLILLGEGPERPALERLARHEGVEDAVLMPGFRRDLANFYSLADVYVNSSRAEGSNRASNMAMAYGRPVVSFDNRQSTQRVVHEETGLLVPAGQVDALGDALLRLAQSDTLRARLGAAAAYARAHLDIRRSIRVIEDTYVEVARAM